MPSDVPSLSIRLELLPGATVAGQMTNAARFGFDAIALPGRFKDHWLPGLRECLADRPLPLASISLGFQHSLLSPEETERAACRQSILGLLDLCAELEVPLLNLPPCLIQDNPARLTDPGEHPSVEARLDALLLEQLPPLARAARDRNVTLLLEPVNRYESDYLNSIEHAARLCARLNDANVACTADFFHLQLEELNPATALTHAADWIQHVHVAENTRVEPGPGSLRFKPGFRALKEANYDGLIEVECRRLSGRAEDVLPASAAYLRRQWLDA